MKKFGLVLLVLALLTGTLAGCKGGSGGSGSSKEITLKWAIPFAKQADYSKVEDEINKLLPTLMPNTKLDLVMDASMGDKWALWMSGKTSFDLAQSGYANDLQSEIMKNSYLPLDDYVKKYAPTIQTEMEKTFHEGYLTGTYNGKLYAVPNIQYHVKETKLIKISDNIKDYFDIDRIVKAGYSSPKTTEELYKALDEGITKADAAKKAGTAKVNIDIARLYKTVAKRGYIFIGGASSNLCYDPYAATPKVMDFYQTEEFKTLMRYANKWYASGNIPKDVLTGEYGDTTGGQIVAVEGGRIGLNERSFTTYTETSASGISISIDKPSNDILGSYNVGSLYTYTSIPFTAKNPEAAMKLLELLRTKEGAPLLNLITYGIKDVHYKQVSENVIDPVDYDGQGSSSSKYGIPNWLVGNMFNMYIVNPPYTKETVDYGKNYYENYLPKVQKSALYGFCFDISPVKSKMSQVLSVNAEFEPQLAYGILQNYQTTYDTLMSRNKTAGINDLVTEFQKQVDNFTAKK